MYRPSDVRHRPRPSRPGSGLTHVVFAPSPLEGHSYKVFNPHYKQPCIFLAYEIYEIVCPSKTLSFLSSLRVKPT